MRPLMKDLDALPWPARDNVATDGVPSSLLFSRSRGLVPSTVILSSRGCPFNCTFCSVHAFYSFSDGSKWRPRSAKSVVDEMTHMVEKWGVQHFVFGDDNVVGSCPKGRARVREMASLLIERNLGIKFNMECCVTDVELSLFSLLRKAGLAQVHLGIESGVPRTLKSFNKPTTVEQNKRAISMLRKLNIDYFPNFILVDPDTTLEELGQSLAFFKESGIYRASQAIYMLYSSRLALFAGTAAFEHYRKAGRTRPLNTLRLTEEEQSIAAATGMSLGYEMKDPRVARFLDLFPRVISELTRRSDDLMRLEEQCRPHAAGTLRLENWPGFLASVGGWRANANTLALRLFEQALTLIEQGAINDETVEQHVEELVSEIDRCDVRHFGKTVNELAHATSMELSGAGIGR
jgi:hypothetical protein